MRRARGWATPPDVERITPSGSVAAKKSAGKTRCQKSHNHSVGRSTLATPERIVAAERELAAGATLTAAAERVGIGRRTLTRWIESGTVVRRRLAPVPGLDLDADALTDEDVEAAMAASVLAAAKAGDWRAARFVLQSRWPQRWGN